VILVTQNVQNLLGSSLRTAAVSPLAAPPAGV
jgi:hypothetical protein